jgi:hypothetical protein
MVARLSLREASIMAPVMKLVSFVPCLCLLFTISPLHRLISRMSIPLPLWQMQVLFVFVLFAVWPSLPLSYPDGLACFISAHALPR